ncbi:carbohydrate esterase family 3 protein [Karstenula rhodostoma CBS 690.94]|uniref:Carbohydrate esterase family 3 protein n=1 Tax=Karstenula rhodostoma CBS 690.94 TaxID=1392251 RepID=A0A9P4UDW0_9PLEO|nr:carbohydrate esterase family 3 protein [Karstenula rhodostoma CBS 690.94]
MFSIISKLSVLLALPPTPPPLRILPLGDSITFGYLNGTGTNGYRAHLLTRLLASNASVDYVGTLSSGTMSDPQNEGHSGWTISQVHTALAPALAFTPNIVLLHLATNDLNGPETPAAPYSKAPERLGSLIDAILATLPKAVVFVAQIVPTTNAGSQERFRAFNAAVPGVVRARAEKGFSVVLVDQSVVPTSELSDGLHPSAVGYAHMGDIWADAVVANWGLVEPVSTLFDC